jgi:hypothetical protein
VNVKHAVPVYRDPAVQLLEGTSKAVLIDLLIGLMRTRYRGGLSCDDPVSMDEARTLVDRVAAWPRRNGMGEPLKAAKGGA